MELQKRHVIYFNIFLLILHLRCGVEATTSTISLEIQGSATAAATSITEDISTKNVDVSSSSTTDSVNESDISITTTENPEDIVGKEVDEIEDLQHGGNFEHLPKTIDEDDVVIVPKPIDNDEQAPSAEFEWIEEEEVDVDVSPFVQAMTNVYGSRKEDYVYQGQLGILLAIFLVVFLMMGYIGFALWRRFIVKRYGNREILINEDDMIDPSDMKHFSL